MRKNARVYNIPPLPPFVPELPLLHFPYETFDLISPEEAEDFLAAYEILDGPDCQTKTELRALLNSVHANESESAKETVRDKPIPIIKDGSRYVTFAAYIRERRLNLLFVRAFDNAVSAVDDEIRELWYTRARQYYDILDITREAK